LFLLIAKALKHVLSFHSKGVCRWGCEREIGFRRGNYIWTDFGNPGYNNGASSTALHESTERVLADMLVAMELRIGRIIKWGEGQGTKERLCVQIVYFYIAKIIQGVSVSYVFRR
jgi:hypothetical protein